MGHTRSVIVQLILGGVEYWTCHVNHSAALNTYEDEIDKQLREILLMEDPDILADLNSNQSDKYGMACSGRNARLICRSVQLNMLSKNSV